MLSPEDILECDTKDFACDGGELNYVWSFLEQTGTTTDDCVPYSSGRGRVGQCPLKCVTDTTKF